MSDFDSLNETVYGMVEDLALVVQSAADYAEFKDAANNLWMLQAGFLVFFMHAGFAMLEAGAVQAKNAVNILFKNMFTVSIGALVYFFIGYSFAYGGDNESNFAGSGGWLLLDVGVEGFAFWFFQMVFAATCATIVSGAVAERTKLEAYFVVAAYLVAVPYPIVSHWIWDERGWLSAAPKGGLEDTLFYSEEGHGCGFIDFAGSGVVHMVGGFSGLVGAYLVGPRNGRFEILPTGKYGDVLPLPAHNMSLCAIGTFILWFGWYGFNVGSTLTFTGELTALVAINTSLAPAAACITGGLAYYFMKGYFDLGVALNCTLGGLVSITAGCATVDPYMSVIIGMIGAGVYLLVSNLVKAAKIDDPLDAIAVHGGCGFWGVLVPGIFSHGDLIAFAYSEDCPVGFDQGVQFATQFVGGLAIIGWVLVTVTPVFLVLKYTIGLRVSDHAQEVGLDESEHGAQAYELGAIDEALAQAERNIKAGRTGASGLPGLGSEEEEDRKVLDKA
jgi:Amt family ammonium transporter